MDGLVKKVVFRVDASLTIGTGHVMRCLTLAEVLKHQGVDVDFICREHRGNLLERIERQGFTTHKLPQDIKYINPDKKENDNKFFERELYGAHWLGSTQQQDAELCKPILNKIKPCWVIVDHYGIDYVWQDLLQNTYKSLMVIDDLADRKHLCDLLLDQTYGRNKEDYTDFVSKNCQMLLGSQYALLRPEFSQWRAYSLNRRANPELKKLLITMGGVDLDNLTGQVLEALKTCDLVKELEVTVVMGETAPYIYEIKELAKAMPFKTEIKINVKNMAELMANSDLAIGAAGATTWERCCLGLPSIQVVLADNQKVIAELLNKAGVALCIEKEQVRQLCIQIAKVTKQFRHFIVVSSIVSDGMGTDQVLRYLK